jgi:hypothetical protein
MRARLIGPEPGVYEADDPPVLFRHDQAGGLEVGLGDDVRIELVSAQRPSGRRLGGSPVPEVGQGGRVAVLERAKVRHLWFVAEKDRTQALDDG